MKDLKPALAARKAAHLYRQPRLVESACQPELRVDGKPMLAFCSNDYLGLANHPQVREAAMQGIQRWGIGSGAAHLVSGHTQAHQALEQELAEWTGRDRALLFSSGYQANLAVAAALLGRNDTLLEDRLNHASLLDAARLTDAQMLRYQHNDPQSAQRQMAQAQGELMLVTDGVFSMDGDIADLPGLAALCQEKSAWLMVDDAHGLGVLGGDGAGSLAHFGLGQGDAPILMGTLGKAFGSAGAFVAGSAELIETLIQQARPYIYSTAQPALVAEATRASLRLVRQEKWRRERLAELVRKFREGAARIGLELASSITPIQPLLLGSAENALALAKALEAEGILVPAIRPPTVPEGSARLRFTFSASHTDEHLRRLLQALAKVSRA